jgi:hypothetical protein
MTSCTAILSLAMKYIFYEKRKISLKNAKQKLDTGKQIKSVRCSSTPSNLPLIQGK